MRSVMFLVNVSARKMSRALSVISALMVILIWTKKLLMVAKLVSAMDTGFLVSPGLGSKDI